MSFDRPYLGCCVLGSALLISAACTCFAKGDTGDYERGMKVLDEARQQRESKRRDELLDEAESAFRAFLQATPKHSSAYSARSQLGNILVERARNTNGNGQAEARILYEQAYETFEKMEVELKVMLAEFALVPNRGRLAIRDRLRADYLQAQLLMAAVLEESADTYDSEDAKRQEILAKAAEEYREISRKYRTLLAGQYAQLYRGRCLWKSGKCKEALQCFEEVLGQPDVKEFIAVKTKALCLALECWLDDSQKQYRQATVRGDEWLKKHRGHSQESHDWLCLRFQLARAHWLLIEWLDDVQERITHREKAIALAESVRRREGKFQAEARKLLAEIGDAAVGSLEPPSFAEAMAAGKEVLDEIKETAAEMARQGIPAAAPDMEDTPKPDPLQLELKQKQAEAIRHFQLALKLADDETPKEDVDIVRYLLCYLHYSKGAYEKAAELGDEAARNPDATGARQSAKITLASYMKMYQAAPPKSEKARGVVKRLEALADHILDTWPEGQEAEEAIDSLIAILIREDHAEDSVAYLEKLATDSPRRNRAALRVGTALSKDFLAVHHRLRTWERDGAPGPDVDAKAVKKQAAKMKQQAMSILADAIQSARESKNITQDVVMAAMSLVQIHIASVEPERAISLLEDPKIGPVTLVQGNHPATQRPTVRREICKTAIWLYKAMDQEEKAKPLRKLLEALEEDG